MRKTIFILCLFGQLAAFGQNRVLPEETEVKTQHNVTIKGERIAYEAKTGTQPVWNEDGEVIAALHYTYYDGATTYFNAKYTVWHLDPSAKMKDRLSFKGYRSGHMMYLRAEDLETSNQDIRDFILRTLPTPGQPAKY